MESWNFKQRWPHGEVSKTQMIHWKVVGLDEIYQMAQTYLAPPSPPRGHAHEKWKKGAFVDHHGFCWNLVERRFSTSGIHFWHSFLHLSSLSLSFSMVQGGNRPIFPYITCENCFLTITFKVEVVACCCKNIKWSAYSDASNAYKNIKIGWDLAKLQSSE